MKILSFLLLLLFLFANTFTAKVIGITDGDSITVLTDKKQQVKIRLEGIDCPELRQDFGNRAKQTTSGLCFKKNVRVKKTGTDRYGRMLAYVYVDNLCVNRELIKLGMAWQYKQYNKDPTLAKLEAKARKAKVGLWAQKNPEAPWEWRNINMKH
jgi:micrococcal nuclease